MSRGMGAGERSLHRPATVWGGDCGDKYRQVPCTVVFFSTTIRSLHYIAETTHMIAVFSPSPSALQRITARAAKCTPGSHPAPPLEGQVEEEPQTSAVWRLFDETATGDATKRNTTADVIMEMRSWVLLHPTWRRPAELVAAQDHSLSTPGEGDRGMTVHSGNICSSGESLLKKRADTNCHGLGECWIFPLCWWVHLWVEWVMWVIWLPAFKTRLTMASRWSG